LGKNIGNVVSYDAYPCGNKNEIELLMNNIEGCNIDQGCDGNWRTTELIKEIVETQYSGQ